MKRLNETQLMQHFKDRADKIGQRALAKELGLTASYINDIYHGRRKISETVASHLGYKRVEPEYYYVKGSV